MGKNIHKGVTVHVVPTEKYKTIRVLIRFSTEMTVEKNNQRALLTSVLETNSEKYPTQQSMSEYLAYLYGTSFGMTVGRKGKNNYLSVILNTVNDKYLDGSEDVLGASFAFLNEVLFHPNFKNNQFDEETFLREKSNLIDYIESVYDDKQSHAALKLQELYFEDEPSQGMPSFGTPEGIKEINIEDLTAYYYEMIENDTIDIFVLGDVTEERVEALASQFPLKDRPKVLTESFYQPNLKEDVLEREEVLSVTQAKLNMGYHMPTYYYDEDYFPLIIFNGLFGGFPHSKLFMNVREKESMAYYASSGIDTFRGYLTVQTGIEASNKARVQTLVAEQLDKLVDGEVSETEMSQTKEMLKNQYISSQDNPSAVIESAYTRMKYSKSDLTPEEWFAKVDAVTVSDVQKIANKINLQTVYFMKGDNE